MTTLLAEIKQRIVVLEEQYGFSENDELPLANEWSDAKQRGAGRYQELLWIRDRLSEEEIIL